MCREIRREGRERRRGRRGGRGEEEGGEEEEVKASPRGRGMGERQLSEEGRKEVGVATQHPNG